MTEKRKTRVFIILFLISTLVYVGWGFWRKWQIEKSHTIVVGKIYRYAYGGRGNAGGFHVDFKTIVNGKEYDASSRYLTSDFNCSNDFIGKTFPVIYNPKHPSISSILIIPSDFARYNYQYPDSLNWVKKYIN